MSNLHSAPLARPCARELEVVKHTGKLLCVLRVPEIHKSVADVTFALVTVDSGWHMHKLVHLTEATRANGVDNIILTHSAWNVAHHHCCCISHTAYIRVIIVVCGS